MNTLTIFLSEERPEKHLHKVRKYKAVLSSEEHNRIINDIYPGPIPDNVEVQINVEVVIKEYSK